MRHDKDCPKSGKWYSSAECRRYSTDGTALGAHIAHTMGTSSEQDIIDSAWEDPRQAAIDSLTGMDAEQAEWESEDGSAW